MVTFTAADDRRQSYAANQARRAVNAARQHKATFGDPNWIMSQSPETMQDRDFMSQAKPAMVAMQGNKDFLTTDKDEKRNLYQMWMNQMKGGDRGARMMDLRGLPSVVQSDPNRYRRGRTMFQDPSKSQGFLGDVGSLLSGNNKAAVYADEYNPFPKAGFGKDWYKDQFPIASGLGSLMEAAENVIPYASWAKRFLPKSNRVPLERDLSWVPEGVGEYDEIPEIPFMEDIVEDTPLEAGDRTDDWWYTPPFDEEVTITDLPEDITETITEDGFVLQESKFPQGNLGTEGNYDYNPIWDLNIMNIQDYELKKKATDAAIQFNNLWKSKEGQEDKSDMYELEKLYEEYMDAVKEGAQPSLEKISHDDLLKESSELEDWMKILGDQHRADSFSRHEIHSPVLDSDSLYYDKNVITPDALDMLESLQPLLLKKGVEI